MTHPPLSPRLTVAVVDDSEAGRYALAHPLRVLGATVLEGEGGQAALRLAQLHPDAIFLDINMPDLNGFEVCRRLKADPETAAIPVIFTTATSANASSVERGLQMGACNVLFDPVTPDHAVTVLAGALVKAGRVQELAFGAYEQTPVLPRVLCLDLGKTGFQTTRPLYGSGKYRVFTATNANAALSVMAATTVQACVFCDPIEEAAIGAALQVAQACPEVPKLVVTSSTVQRRLFSEQLGAVVISDPLAAVARLHELIASANSRFLKAQQLLRRARELRQRSAELRLEMREQIEGMRDTVKGFKRGK